MPTVDEVVEGYIRLRDRRDEIKKRQAEELEPIKASMDKMENWLMAQLNAQHAESIRCKAGTAFKETRTSAKVEDWDATLPYILENELYHLLERRVSKTAVEEMAENGQEVPGVSLNRETVVRIRRK